MKRIRTLTAVGLALLFSAAAFFLFMPSCVVAGTLIDTPSGPRPVETLEAGDAIWTQGPSGGREPGRVLRRIGGLAGRFLEITMADGLPLRVTGVHPIATREGWTPAGTLRAGDLVRGVDGWRAVASIGRRTSLTRVYDLEVEPNSNFYGSGVLVHNKSSQRWSNERNARASLKTLSYAQADFHANDRDGNKKADYWVGDVAGFRLYYLKVGDEPIRLFEASIADADAAPLNPAPAKPKAGYLYAVIPQRADGKPLEAASEFAFCAWPEAYGPLGKRTFIINQEGVIWQLDRGRSERVMRWPKDPQAEGWTRQD